MDFFNAVGLMAYPLLVTSIIALAIIFDRVVHFAKAIKVYREKDRAPNGVLHQLHGLKHTSLTQRENWCALQIQELQNQWKKRLTLLSLLATLSPLMGLFGTVWGLVLMFKNIAHSNQNVTPAVLADGLWEAMYSTVAGLAIAMCCLLASGLFNALKDQLIAQLTLAFNRTNYQLNFSESSHVTPAE